MKKGMMLIAVLALMMSGCAIKKQVKADLRAYAKAVDVSKLRNDLVAKAQKEMDSLIGRMDLEGAKLNKAIKDLREDLYDLEMACPCK